RAAPPPAPPRREPRASGAAATSEASRGARAPRDTGPGIRPGPRPRDADRSARIRMDRRASSPGYRQRGLEYSLLVGTDIEGPHQQERGALVDALEAALRERHRLDRTPGELRR